MDNNHYNKRLKGYAREHRNYSTKAEVKLWCELFRNRQMMGYPFLRQRPIGKYIADFFCKELKLIVETDGISHTWEDAPEKDRERLMFWNELGYTVLRFDDKEFMYHLNHVYLSIEEWIIDWEKRNGKR